MAIQLFDWGSGILNMTVYDETVQRNTDCQIADLLSHHAAGKAANIKRIQSRASFHLQPFGDNFFLGRQPSHNFLQLAETLVISCRYGFQALLTAGLRPCWKMQYLGDFLMQSEPDSALASDASVIIC